MNEQKLAKMLAIINRLAEPEAGVTGDEMVDERCVFCSAQRDAPPTYEWRGSVKVMLAVPPFQHEPTCIIAEARAIIEEMSA